MADLNGTGLPGSQIGERLRHAAAAPQGALDLADVARRARRVRRNQRVGTAAAIAALVAPAAFAGSMFLVPETTVEFAAGSGGGPTIAAPSSPTPEPSETASPTDTVQPPPSPAGEIAVTASPSPTASPTRQSSATVVISDPPGAPERRPSLPGDSRHPAVVLTLLVERTDVRQGTGWNGWLEARNTGDKPISLGDAPCWALWGLYRDGHWIGGQAGSTCDQPHPQQTLAPGATLRVPLRFDTVEGDVRGERETQVEPGRYQAAAALRVRTGAHAHAGVWYAPTVTMTVKAPASGG